MLMLVVAGLHAMFWAGAPGTGGAGGLYGREGSDSARRGAGGRATRDSKRDASGLVIGRGAVAFHGYGGIVNRSR